MGTLHGFQVIMRAERSDQKRMEQNKCTADEKGYGKEREGYVQTYKGRQHALREMLQDGAESLTTIVPEQQFSTMSYRQSWLRKQAFSLRYRGFCNELSSSVGHTAEKVISSGLRACRSSCSSGKPFFCSTLSWQLLCLRLCRRARVFL